MKINDSRDIFQSKVNAPCNLLYLPKSIQKQYENPGDEFDPSSNSGYGLIIKHIRPHSKVLDMGCSYGYLGEYLAAHQGCDVFGMDIDPQAIDQIKRKGIYKDACVCDLERLKEDRAQWTDRGFSDFDTIVCFDVIEHIRNINEFVISTIELLNSRGSLFVSIPNINHIDIVYNLIRGRFNYSPFGILDNSHLRFFTMHSFAEWIGILGKDNDLNLDIELIGKTKLEQMTETDEILRSKIHDAVEVILTLYDTFGTMDDAMTLQNIFRIRHSRTHAERPKTEVPNRT
jgi:2-polyprenyl-3-methyl-5-hydroxy-6-metoxy-1,4-benzoquinol methylase